MFLIESNKQLEQLIKKNTKAALIVPVWSSHIKHEWSSKLSFYYLKMKDGNSVVININHIDADSCSDIDIHKFISADTLVYGNRYIASIGIDYEWVYFETMQEPFSWSTFFHSLQNEYDTNYTELNDCIPLMKWVEKLDELPILEVNDKSMSSYSECITTLGEIEKSAIKVDTNIFQSKLVEDGFLYSQYNPYTITGRPSNRHGGINWSALKKSDGIRAGIISRWQSGKLVQIDFESYHIRLIAKIVGYQFPNGVSAHEHLAECYGVDYETSKRLTFKYLYGGMDADVLTIPFFKKVNDWLERSWNEFVIRGYLETPILKRRINFKRIEQPSQQKVFNYLLQAIETEVNYKKLRQVLDYLKEYNSKIILYTYDAILIDVHPKESDCIDNIKSIMEHGGFPVRIYAGNNYDNLTFIQ